MPRQKNMLPKILQLIWDFLAISGCFLIISYIIYKLLKLPSWEEGIEKMCTELFCCVYEALTGQPIPQKMENYYFALLEDELAEIRKQLTGHPYETPGFDPPANSGQGYITYSFHAVGLSAAYRDVPPDELEKIIFGIIDNHYLDTRKSRVRLYNRIATPTRFSFCLPLSEKGRKVLEGQEAESRCSGKQGSIPMQLEETIDIFPESGEDNL